MAYPPGIQTVTLRLGSTFDSAGTPAKITGEVAPMWGPGADHLVWTDTGQTYAKVLTPLMWDDAEKVAYATVPHPTQAGWRDQTQAAFSGWSYRITAVAVYAGGQRQAFERTVTPGAGDTVIDVDLLPNGVAATPTVVAEWEAARADALAALAASDTALSAAIMPTLATTRQALRVAFLGDSITGYGERFPRYAGILSDGQIRVHQIDSHSGYTSGQVLGQVSGVTEAVDKADACFVLVGANDGQGQVALSTYAANVTAICDALAAAGIVPIIGTSTPLSSATWAPHAAGYATWAREYAAQNGIIVVDVHAALANPATGYWAAGYDVGDGVHPSPAGQKAIGQAIATTLAGIMRPSLPVYSAAAVGTTNIIANPGHLTDTNADGVADNRYTAATIDASFAPSRLAAEGGEGWYWQRVTLAGTAASKRLTCRIPAASGGRWSPGDRLRFAVKVRSGQDGVLWNASVVGYTSGFSVTVNTSLMAASRQIAGTLIADFTVPADTATLEIPFDMAAGSGTFDFALPTLFNLTALGLA